MAINSSTQPAVSSLMGGREFGVVDAGAYFYATGTPGTGVITSGSVQAFTQTTPYLSIFNGGTVNAYPTFIRLTQSVVGATGSTATYLTGALVNQNAVTSGGTALTKVNTSSLSVATSNAVITAGAITAPAPVSSRTVFNVKVRSLTIGVVHDSITLNFGDAAQTLVSTLINNTTSKSDVVFNCVPVLIAPGWSLSIVHWAGSQTTGSTYEVEVGWVEK